MSRMKSFGIAAALGLVLVGWWVLLSSRPESGRVFAQSGSEAESLKAFAVVASVLTSPRCLNCHVAGDSPLQGDGGTTHNMNVKRGPDGRGTPAMHCANCHQDQNSTQLHAPPGRPDWRMPPPATRMAWQGLTVGEICRSLKDPAKNGGRTTAQLIEHVRDDRIVNWGWDPGPGRSLPPVSHEEFVAQVTGWVQTGSACPEESRVAVAGDKR
jgi:hypothetical protein